MKKVMFHEDDRLSVCDAFDITDRKENGAVAISAEECRRFVNSLDVKCYGTNSEGYIVYGK